jgi:hypothetical protein
MTQLDHAVREYDMQSEGTALVSGWQIEAQVTGVSGRKFTPILVAICPSKDDADEIAAFLNAKYGGE